MVELSKANVADHIRFVLSSLILIFSAVLTFYAIILKKTLFWDAVPGWVALILFLFVLFCLGVVAGIQIAVVELKRQHPDSYRKSHPRAYSIGQSAFSGDNMERFLIGRQVIVASLVYFAAKLTTIYIEEGEQFLFHAPKWFRSIFLETGILGCIVLIIIAQLTPQIVAAKYPVHFLQFIIMKPVYYICIGVEMSGLTHASWLLSTLMQLCFRMKDDKTTANPVDIAEFREDSDRGDNHDDEMAPGEKTKLTNMSEESVSILVDEVNSSDQKVYLSPEEMATQIRQSGHHVPNFLLDISHPDHVPPHIIASELMSTVKTQQKEIEDLKLLIEKMNNS